MFYKPFLCGEPKLLAEVAAGSEVITLLKKHAQGYPGNPENEETIDNSIKMCSAALIVEIACF